MSSMSDPTKVLQSALELVLADQAVRKLRSVDEYVVLYPSQYREFLKRELTSVLGEGSESRSVANVRRSLPEGRRAAHPMLASGSASEDQEGREFGRYRVLERVGVGGQGVVYRARDPKLGIDVALKLLRLGADADAVVRFRREATAAAAVQHHAVCRVRDFGVNDGTPFMVMDFIEGVTLAQLIEERKANAVPMSSSEIVAGGRLLIRVAEGVQAAHDAGLLHRDLKPGNIMIRAGGDPVVLDFGLAVFEDDQPMTMASDEFGTLPYMAPEQVGGKGPVRGKEVDVYALGVMAYQLLTLSLPFETPTRAALYHQIMTETAPLARRRAASIPRDLETVLAVAMEKDPAARYSTAKGFAEDIDAALSGRPISGRRPTWPVVVIRLCGRHRVLSSLVASIILILISAVSIVSSAYRTAAASLREQRRLNAVDVLEIYGRRGQSAMRQHVEERLANVSDEWRGFGFDFYANTVDTRSESWPGVMRGNPADASLAIDAEGRILFVRNGAVLIDQIGCDLPGRPYCCASDPRTGIVYVLLREGDASWTVREAVTGALISRPSLADELASASLGPDGKLLMTRHGAGVRWTCYRHGPSGSSHPLTGWCSFAVGRDVALAAEKGVFNMVHRPAKKLSEQTCESVAVDPSGRWFAVSQLSNSLAVADVRTGNIIVENGHAFDGVTALAMTSDTILVGTRWGNVVEYDLRLERQLAVWRGGGASIRGIRSTPESVFAWGADGLHRWDRRRGSQVSFLETPFWGARVSASGRRTVGRLSRLSVCADLASRVRYWHACLGVVECDVEGGFEFLENDSTVGMRCVDAATEHLLSTRIGTKLPFAVSVVEIRRGPSGLFARVGDSLWREGDGDRPASAEGVLDLAVSPDRGIAAVLYRGGRVEVEGKVKRSLTLESGEQLRSLSVSNHGDVAAFGRSVNRVIVVTRDGVQRSFDLDRGQCVAVHPDGRQLFVGCRDGAILCYELQTRGGSLLCSLQASRSVLALAFDEAGDRLFASCGGIEVFDRRPVRSRDPVPVGPWRERWTEEALVAASQALAGWPGARELLSEQLEEMGESGRLCDAVEEQLASEGGRLGLGSTPDSVLVALLSREEVSAEDIAWCRDVFLDAPKGQLHPQIEVLLAHREGEDVTGWFEPDIASCARSDDLLELVTVATVCVDHAEQRGRESEFAVYASDALLRAEFECAARRDRVRDLVGLLPFHRQLAPQLSALRDRLQEIGR